MNNNKISHLTKQDHFIFEIGLFETNQLTFDKVYKQSAYIFLMLKKYMNGIPKIKLKIYGSDLENFLQIEKEAEKRAFNISKQEFSENNKKIELYRSLNIGEQYWQNIEIKYINYDLKNKYNL